MNFSPFRIILILLLVSGCQPPEKKLDLTPCEQWVTADDQIQCNYLNVPLDWDNEEDGTIDLFYVVIPAISEIKKPNPIIFLQGGPGGSATPLVDFFKNTSLRRDRDIIIMDQRGTGYSGAQCADMGERYFEVFAEDYTPAEEIKALKKISVSCSEEMTDNEIPKTAFTSNDIVRDFEALREYLGVEQWNVLGASYGTRLGMTYLREYPDAIRASALQGLFPPETRLYEHLISNLNRSLELVFSSCESNEECNESYPDLQQSFNQTIIDLESNPYSFTYLGKEIKVNPQDYILMITYALYSRVTIASVPALINSIKDDNQFRILQAINVIRNTLNTINGAMYMSVTAYEELPFSGDPEIQEELKTYSSLAPGPAFYTSDPALLETWHSARASSEEDKPVTSEKPILLVSGRLDPVTPPSNAENMLPYLPNATHIVFENESHAIFSQCYFHILNRFFDDPNGEYMSDCYQFDNSLTVN